MNAKDSRGTRNLIETILFCLQFSTVFHIKNIQMAMLFFFSALNLLHLETFQDSYL